MSQPSDFMHELESLLAVMAESSLSLPQRARLRKILNQHPEARNFYKRYIEVHVMLEWEAGAATPAAPIDGETVQSVDVELPSRADLILEAADQERRARIEREASAALERQRQADSDAERRASLRRLAGLSKSASGSKTKHYVIPKPLFYGGIAAAIAIAAAIIWPMYQGKQNAPGGVQSEQIESSVEFVAKLDSSIDAVWSNGRSHVEGQTLPQGKYELKSGVVKITYESGAEVIVEGPATFSLKSASKLSLDAGKLAGLCPTEESRGFVVQTANARITDLGTEFGVLLKEDGTAEAHVFDGVIEVAPIMNGAVQTARAQHVNKGKARKIDRSGGNMAAIAVHEVAVIRQRELDAIELSDTSPYNRWLAHRFKMLRDQDLVVHFDFINGIPDDGLLPNSVPGESLAYGTMAGIRSIGGRFPEKVAAHYDSKDDRIEIDIEDQYDQITLAGWFYFGVEPELFSLLTSYDWVTPSGGIHWHANIERFGFDQRTANGTNTDHYKAPYDIRGKLVRDWAHIAITFDTRTGMVSTYVNGKQIGSDRINRNDPIRLGEAGIGYWKDNGLGQPDRTFFGRIDEFTIWKRALSGAEIEKVFRAGKPDV